MSHPKPVITIHFGASNDDITVDGRTFVRHEFSRDDRDKMRAMIVNGLKATRYFSKEALRFRPKRRRPRHRPSKAI